MKNIAIIPARGGSKRLPNKNILLLDGIPLIAHSIMYAKKNLGIIDEVFVSTDDSEIKAIALSYGAKVIDRPADLSGDYEPTVSVLKHVILSLNDEITNIILLQPTNPLRFENLLSTCFEKFISLNVDSLFTVTPNHQKFGQIENNKFIPFNYKFGQRSQDLAPLYYENGLLYITKSNLILDGLVISENGYPFIIDHPYGTIDIDTQEDLDFTEFLLNKYK